METIRIRRLSAATEVNVTVKEGEHSVHWKVRVLGPTAVSITSAINQCRTQCSMLLEGVKEAMK